MSRPLRVLIVIHRFPPDDIGGVERVTQALAYGLARQGHTITVAAARAGSVYAPYPVREPGDNQINMYRMVGGPTGADTFLAHHTTRERIFERILVETQPDVVHIQHLVEVAPRFIEIAHRFGVPVVLSLHDFYMACPRIILRNTTNELCEGPQGGHECARVCFAHEGDAAELRWSLRTAYFRRLLRLPERLITPSAYFARFFTEFGVDPARLRVIPNGVTIPPLEMPDQYTPPQQRGRLHLVFLGSLLPHKGAHLIIQALRLAGLTNVDFTIIGQAPNIAYVSELRHMAEQVPGLKLRLYGAYEPEQLPGLLHEVDCVITPSIWPETFAIVTREALTRGVPVIVSRIGALPDAVVEGVNGFTFDPTSLQELAVLLRRLWDDESLLPRLRAGARETRVTTVADHIAATLAVYHEALGEARPGSRVSLADQAELDALHTALLKVGFGPS